MKGENVRRVKGQFELTEKMKDSSLWNEDIHTTPIEDRDWNKWHIAGLWVAMSVTIPTYMLGSSLIAQGMNWWQAVITVIAGCLVVLIPMTLISQPGVKYGIPFPVLIRSSFGTHGARLTALLRAFVACGWFGILTTIGGNAVYVTLIVIFPALNHSLYLGNFIGLNIVQLISFLGFWLLEVYVISHGMQFIRRLSVFAAPLLFILGFVLLGWVWYSIGSFGKILSATYLLAATEHVNFWYIFWPGLTAIVGYWSTLALNIPDFMRFARSQKDQIEGQLMGMPTVMGLYTFIGITVTGATIVMFGKAIWDPVMLLHKIHNPIILVVIMLCILLATLCCNLTCNIVSTGNDFSNMLPKIITFKTGCYIATVIGIIILPWKLIADPAGYIYRWLVAYSALLGAVGGIMICDIYLIRKKHICLNSLFKDKGQYYYWKGWNIRAFVSFIIGVIPNIPGFLEKAGVVSVHFFPVWVFTLYNYAWFISFIISFIVYFILIKLAGIKNEIKVIAK